MLNKQKKKYTSKKETISCNRPIHMAHYSYSHLGLCRKHFAIASKITISEIESGFAVLYSFTWHFKAEKEQHWQENRISLNIRPFLFVRSTFYRGCGSMEITFRSSKAARVNWNKGAVNGCRVGPGKEPCFRWQDLILIKRLNRHVWERELRPSGHPSIRHLASSPAPSRESSPIARRFCHSRRLTRPQAITFCHCQRHAPILLLSLPRDSSRD